MSEASLLEFLPYTWKIVFGILMAITSVLATIENGIVLLTIYNFQILHTTTNKILSSLALSDFLTGTTVALLFAMQLLNEKFIDNATVDLLRRYLSTFLIGASVLTLGFISYDRSLHLRQLNNYKMSRKKLYFILFICWLIPLLIPLLRKVDKSEKAYSAVIVIFVAVIFVGISFCYFIIFKALHHQKKIATVRFSGERRAVKTVFVILTVFVVMIIPVSIHHALNVSQAMDEEKLAKSYIIGMVLCVGNSAINPVIYYLRTPNLKKHIQRLIGIWRKSDIDSNVRNEHSTSSITTIN